MTQKYHIDYSSFFQKNKEHTDLIEEKLEKFTTHLIYQSVPKGSKKTLQSLGAKFYCYVPEKIRLSISSNVKHLQGKKTYRNKSRIEDINFLGLLTRYSNY